MNKKISLIILSIFILLFFSMNNINAYEYSQTSLGAFQQDECMDIIQVCSDCTYNNISRVIYPNSTTAVSNVVMSVDDTFYNYTFCLTSGLGKYIVNGFGDENGTKTSWAYDFEVTPNGETPTLAKSLIHISLLFMIIIFLITSILLYNKARDERVFLRELIWMGVSYLIALPMWFMLWQITEQYLTSIKVLSSVFYGMTIIWFIGFFAVFVILTYKILVELYENAQVQRLMNKGMMEDEAVERIKRRRR